MKTRAAVAFAAKQPLEIVEVDLEGPRAFEVLVERRATQPYVLSEPFHGERFCEVLFEPEDRLRDSVSGRSGGGYLTQPRALWAAQQSIRNLAKDKRSQGSNILRRFK